MWIFKGLTTGIKTTRYPDSQETGPGITPGMPVGGEYPESQVSELIKRCPTEALAWVNDHVVVDNNRCVHCFRCARGLESPVAWQTGFEWATWSNEVGSGQKLSPAFERSIHILVVDAGDCGACLNEVRQLNNPYYNMHRLGFFITPTPREADVMLVVGPVTEHMRLPLQKAYDAMPTPKRVIAVGNCALSGSVFGPSMVCASGVRDALPVEVEVPGQPPPPLSILHGLLVAVGRKPAAPSHSVSTAISEQRGSAS